MVPQVDGDGREVRRRLYVFTFDEDVYRESRYTGQVWLEEDEATSNICRASDGARDAPRGARQGGPRSENGGDSVARSLTSTIISDHREERETGEETDDCALCSPPVMVLVKRNEEEKGENREGSPDGPAPSGTSLASRDVPDGTRQTETAEMSPFDKRPPFLRARSITSATAPGGDDGIDPRRFVPTGAPDRTRCARCGGPRPCRRCSTRRPSVALRRGSAGATSAISRRPRTPAEASGSARRATTGRRGGAFERASGSCRSQAHDGTKEEALLSDAPMQDHRTVAG